MAVSVREFKARLSHYLAQVRAGQPLEISSHRKVIARVTAVMNEETRGIDRMLQAGAAQWARGKPEGAEIRLASEGKPVSGIVLEDRG